MLKIINYFVQSIVIYFFFLIIITFRLKISRKIFSNLFSVIGPIFKSKDVINQNLNIYSPNLSNFQRKSIIKNMWKNYGMTFVEYMFLDYFKKNDYHIKVKGEQNLKNLANNKPVVLFLDILQILN